MPRHSKLQLQVLSLYRQFLREAKDKPGLRSYVQEQFKKGAQMQKTDIIQIEYAMRKAQKQLDMLKTTSVSGVGVFEKEEEKTQK